jgi:hypothetical protein
MARRVFSNRLGVSEFVERESLRPDLGRAVRATLAFLVPVVLALRGWLPVEVTFAAIAAQNINFIDVRGAYSLRFAMLVAMALVLTGTTWLGTISSGSTASAVAATAAIALVAGLWRHLTPEYGPGLATPAALLFFIALAAPWRWGPVRGSGRNCRRRCNRH